MKMNSGGTGLPHRWSFSLKSRTFVRELMRVCIREEEALEAMIAPRLENWELDRISLMDRILIRMALAELLHFPTIPVKVSINEIH